MIRTTIFTSANRLYEMFVVPFVVTSLIHNDDARVEICLEDAGEFESKNADAIDVLDRHFGSDRFLFRDIVAGIDVPSPNTVRFLETPEVTTEFTYIGDVDILILEAISPIHIARMSDSGLPYSNVLREGREALSGLHFTRSDAYYPVEIPADADLNLDEALLYQLVTRRGLPLPPGGLGRPTHGYHLSPNRAPLPAVVDGHAPAGWGVESKARLEFYCALRRHRAWRDIRRHLDRRFHVLLGLLELALASRHPSFESNQNGEVSALLDDVSLVRGVIENESPFENGSEPEKRRPRQRWRWPGEVLSSRRSRLARVDRRRQ